MDKTLIPEESELIVYSVEKHYTKANYHVRQLEALSPDAPYRTTLVASQSSFRVLIEAQKHPRVLRRLEALARWLAAQRMYCELYIATDEIAELSGAFLRQLRHEGIGLLIVDEQGALHIEKRARNSALIVTPDPGLSLGPSRGPVQLALEKFNDSDRKDGLRDMCEIVESLTEEIIAAAARRGLLTMTETVARKQDWSTQIDGLASTNVCKGNPLIDAILKGDLHSLRNSRNLVDHAVRGRREDARRQRQYADKMMLGPRLAAELITIKRRVSR